MEKVIYKSDHFGCALLTPKQFAEKLQKMLDKYANEGWKLHSYQMLEFATYCSVVFYKEEQ